MTDDGSIESYLSAVQSALEEHPSYREGQAYFIELHVRRPDLTEQIVGTEFDPFSVDSRIPRFLAWIEDRW